MIRHRWYTSLTGGGYYDLANTENFMWLTTGNVEGMGEAKLDDFTRAGALVDGQTYTGYRAQAREVFWPLAIDWALASDWQAAQTLFWSLFKPGVVGRWEVVAPNGTTRTLRCRYVGDSGYAPRVDPSLIGAKVERVGLELVADDPWWRGPARTETWQTSGEAVPFYNTTNTHVFNIMPATASGLRNISNPGDISAWPKYTIQGPVTDLKIWINQPNIYTPNIAAEINVPLGSTLVIDTDPGRQTVTLDGVNAWPQLTRADFAPVTAGGTATIDVSLVGTGSLAMSFEPRYRRAI